MISFFIPGKARGKDRPRFNKRSGEIYTPKKTHHYEGLVSKAAYDCMNGERPCEGPVRVDIRYQCVIPASWSKKKHILAANQQIIPVTKPDIDNVIKSILDGMNTIVYRDDKQVAHVEARKEYTGATPGVMVTVTKLQPSELILVEGA